nr:hypothetical protein BaRGS_025644 [Batillaria attramentaria]
MDPALIRELRLNSHKADEDPAILELNSTLDAVCLWENGNPPVRGLLLDRHGDTLNARAESGQVQYKFPQVGCQDAGLIRCPPDLIDPDLKTMNMDAGQSADVTFRVRTHKTEFEECSVTMAESGGEVTANVTSLNTSSSSARDFLCATSLTGIPPDLKLTVSMKQIRKQDEGKWRLQLTNDVGTDYLDFILAVSESK